MHRWVRYVEPLPVSVAFPVAVVAPVAVEGADVFQVVVATVVVAGDGSGRSAQCTRIW